MGTARTGELHLADFEDLAQRLKTASLEFRELVEKEDAAVSPRDLAGTHGSSTPEKPRQARAVVRRPEGSGGGKAAQRCLRRSPLDTGDVDGFVSIEGR